MSRCHLAAEAGAEAAPGPGTRSRRPATRQVRRPQRPDVVPPRLQARPGKRLAVVAEREAAAGAPVAPGDDRPRPFQGVPEKYAKRQGALTAEGIAALKQFVSDGGTIVAIGSAAAGAVQTFGLPLAPHVTASRNDYYIPGSVLSI